MRNNIRIGIVCAIILALIGTSFAAVSISEPTSDSTESSATNLNNDREEILEKYSQLNGDFTENRGQIENDEVKYYIASQGVWLLDDGVVFDLQETQVSMDLPDPENLEKGLPHEIEETMQTTGVALKLTFVDANKVAPVGINVLQETSNFLYNDNPDGFLVEVPSYTEIVYTNIYYDIDLIFRNGEEGLKYDFIVHPGGDPDDIRLSYEGANDLSIDPSGDLNINTDIGVVKDSQPYIYQERSQVKDEVEGNFKLLDTTTYGFEISGIYDDTRDLVIDPMVYSTFVGGYSHEIGLDIVVDPDGNAYVTGYTLSQNFPVTFGAYDTSINGNYDVFVTKLNPAGSALVYSTFVGGKHHDMGYGIEINKHGEAYVTGSTLSPNFPTTPGAFDTTQNGNYDVFVFKLKSSGAGLVYSTFVGAKKHDIGMDIALDKDDNAYVTGYTISTGFPTIVGAFDTTFNGGIDAFVFELKWTGANLIYSTFYGAASIDAGFGITLDLNRNAYVTGTQAVGAVGYEALVFKLDSSGSTIIYSKNGGGSSHDWGYDIVLDAGNNAYVIGFTLSNNFPVTAGAFDTTFNGGYDAFVFKLKPGGVNLAYCTYLGGSSHEMGLAIDIDNGNNVYLTGFTMSSNFPVTAGAYDTTINGQYDVFLSKLSFDGATLLYSTFVGGKRSEGGYGIAIDSFTDSYVTGYTNSVNFPITAVAFDPTYNGGNDAFVFKHRLPAVSPATAGPMKSYWVLGQYPRHTWMDFTTLSTSGATVKFWGTNTMGTLKTYLGSLNIPAPEAKYQPKKISRNVGEFFSDATSDQNWLTGEWYYLEMRSEQPFMVVFSRSVILEGSHVTHSDQILSKPPTKHNTDWWFTNGGSLARDDKILIYTDEPNMQLKFKDRVVTDHYPYVSGSPGDSQLAGYSAMTLTGLHMVDAKDVMNNYAGLYSFHAHACFDYAIGVFDRYFHSDDGDPIPSSANASVEYNSDYYHGWYGLDSQKPRFIEVKDTRIYAEQPAEQSWGVYTPDNKLRYENINGATQIVGYSSHPDMIHRDTVKKSDVSLYPAGAPPYYVDVQQLPGGVPFSSDLPAADEVIAHRATYFGYDPVVAKLQIANPYDCDVVVVVLNKQNLKRTIFEVPSHSAVSKDLYYDADFANFFDPVTTSSWYRPGIPDHGFVIEVGAYIIKDYKPPSKNQSLTHVDSSNTAKLPKPILVDVFQKVTDTLMLRQYYRILMGTYDDDVCPEPDIPDNCTVATPTIKPDGGCFDYYVYVNIVTATPNATIYFTMDGSEPTQSSTKYTGPIALNHSTTIRARAYKDGCTPSGIAKVEFTKKEKVATPTISPKTGTFSGPVNVTITCSTPNATIYYTLNGSDPDRSSSVYTGTFVINSNATVKARAYKDGCWYPSDIARVTIMMIRSANYEEKR